MSTQTDTKLDSIAAVRSAFHDVFGYTEPDEAFGEYAEQASDRLAVGEDNCVMYAPEDVRLPIGIPVAECEPVTDTDHARADPDTSDCRDEKRDLTVFRTDESEHTIQTWYVDMLAELLGENHDEVHDRAHVHPNYAHYPVVFDVPHGHVLVAPFIPDE